MRGTKHDGQKSRNVPMLGHLKASSRLLRLAEKCQSKRQLDSLAKKVIVVKVARFFMQPPKEYSERAVSLPMRARPKAGTPRPQLSARLIWENLRHPLISLASLLANVCVCVAVFWVMRNFP